MASIPGGEDLGLDPDLFVKEDDLFLCLANCFLFGDRFLGELGFVGGERDLFLGEQDILLPNTVLLLGERDFFWVKVSSLDLVFYQAKKVFFLRRKISFWKNKISSL